MTYCDTQQAPVPPPPMQQFNIQPLLEQADRMRAQRMQEDEARRRADSERQAGARRQEIQAAIAQREQEEIARDGEAGRRRVETRRILADLLSNNSCSSAVALAERDGDDMMKRVTREQCGQPR